MTHVYNPEISYPLDSEFVQKAIDTFVSAMEDKVFSIPEMDDNLSRAKISVYDARDTGRITQEDFVKSMHKIVALVFRLKRDGKATA